MATLLLMAEQIEWILAPGRPGVVDGRRADSAERLYTWAEKTSYTTPFVTDPARSVAASSARSTSTGVDAATVAKVLHANGIVDTEPYRKLGRNQLRIAMYPAIDPDDVEALTACIDHVVEQMSPAGYACCGPGLLRVQTRSSMSLSRAVGSRRSPWPARRAGRSGRTCMPTLR